jgi:hypothetical protein
MIRIVAHRGLWQDKKDQNSLHSIRAALDAGFGVETDLWAIGANGLIAHDYPSSTSGLPDLLTVLTLDHRKSALLALNVKSDGMTSLLCREDIAPHLKTWDWFAFDMSIPETVRLSAANVPFVRRVSDYEPPPTNLLGIGYWVDCYSGQYPDFATDDKLTVFVSPELHGFDPEPAWEELKTLDGPSLNLAICTDFPQEASQFFRASHDD